MSGDSGQFVFQISELPIHEIFVNRDLMR